MNDFIVDLAKRAAQTAVAQQEKQANYPGMGYPGMMGMGGFPGMVMPGYGIPYGGYRPMMPYGMGGYIGMPMHQMMPHVLSYQQGLGMPHGFGMAGMYGVTTPAAKAAGFSENAWPVGLR